MTQILIVEDNIFDYEELRDHLMSAGHGVSPSLPSYGAAEAYLRMHDPDVAILDIELQGVKNGLMLAEWIRDTKDIPIIFISNHTDDDIIDRAVGISPLFARKNSRHHLVQIDVLISLALRMDKMNDSPSKTGILVLPHVTKLWEDAHRNEPGAKGPDPRTLERTRVDYQDIYHITKDKDYILIETLDGKKYNHTLNLKDILGILPSSFLQIERGSIINLEHITARSNGRIIEVHGISLKVGVRYLEVVNRRLNDLFD